MTLSSDECDLLVVGGGPRWFHRRDIRGSCRFAICRPAEGASGVGRIPPSALP